MHKDYKHRGLPVADRRAILIDSFLAGGCLVLLLAALYILLPAIVR